MNLNAIIRDSLLAVKEIKHCWPGDSHSRVCVLETSGHGKVSIEVYARLMDHVP